MHLINEMAPISVFAFVRPLLSAHSAEEKGNINKKQMEGQQQHLDSPQFITFPLILGHLLAAAACLSVTSSPGDYYYYGKVVPHKGRGTERLNSAFVAPQCSAAILGIYAVVVLRCSFRKVPSFAPQSGDLPTTTTQDQWKRPWEQCSIKIIIVTILHCFLSLIIFHLRPARRGGEDKAQWIVNRFRHMCSLQGLIYI